jgi:hypothetical protein
MPFFGLGASESQVLNGCTPPVVADFPVTFLDTGASVTQGRTALLCTAPAAAGVNYQLALQSKPVGTPWTRYMAFQAPVGGQLYNSCAFVWRESGTGKFVAYGLYIDSGRIGLYEEYLNSRTSRNTFGEVTGWYAGPGVLSYFSFADNGTSFVVAGSQTGDAGTYRTLLALGNTAFLTTYDQIGLGWQSFSTGGPVTMAIQHWGTAAPAITS